MDQIREVWANLCAQAVYLMAFGTRRPFARKRGLAALPISASQFRNLAFDFSCILSIRSRPRQKESAQLERPRSRIVRRVPHNRCFGGVFAGCDLPFDWNPLIFYRFD